MRPDSSFSRYLPPSRNLGRAAFDCAVCGILGLALALGVYAGLAHIH